MPKIKQDLNQWYRRRISPAAMMPVAAAMAVACLALSAWAPKALSETTMWAACEINCQKYGWMAIEFAPWLGFMTAALVVSLLGRASYDLFHLSNLSRPSWQANRHKREKIGKALYTLGGALCVVAMIAAPNYTPDVIPNVVTQTSLRAAGITALTPAAAQSQQASPQNGQVAPKGASN